ncbi:MAG: hypothetical protein ACYS9X_22960 [Planctomycetota bacterium]
MKNAVSRLPAVVVAALALAGCGGAGGVLSDDLHAPDAAGPRPADGSGPVGALETGAADDVAEVDDSPADVPADARASVDTAAIRDAQVDAESAEADRKRAAEASARPSPAALRAEAAGTPTATDEPTTQRDVAESDESAPVPAVAARAAVPLEEGGGVCVWLLGLLLAGTVAGGGWFALQPKWVRRRVLRTMRAAPGRILARFRKGSADGATSTSTWSTPGPAWIASARGDGDGDARSKGTGARRQTVRRPKSITNATLPAMRVPVDEDADGADG